MVRMASIPSRIQAGDTLSLTYSDADYPASSYTVTAYLRGPVNADIAYSADGDNHAATVAAATTATWSAGIYRYTLRADDGAGGYTTLETGWTEVLADLAAVTATSTNASHAKTVLDAIEAVIENRATSDQLRVKINNREIEKLSLSELYQFRAKYRAEYQQELRANGIANALGVSGNQVRVRL